LGRSVGSTACHVTSNLIVDCEFEAISAVQWIWLTPRGSAESSTKLNTEGLKSDVGNNMN
jgi:hypothetical protein